MFARTALVCAVAVVTSSCAAILLKMAAPEHGDEIVVPRYVVRPLPTPWKPASPIAGASRVDITPPPGYPTGGHGPAGSVARGSLTRLYARAFFFADTDGSVLVLVSCELFAVPGGLSASVARKVALKRASEGIVLPPEAVIVAATHTHQSPGNYLTAQTYNAFASNYPGFSPALFDFFVERVSSAVDEAIADALKNNSAATLTIRSAAIEPWLQLNRSPRTFLLNADAQAMMNELNPPRPGDPMCRPGSERGEATNDWDLLGCPRLRAVDRTMTILEIARGSDTIGLLVFFPLHPTVLDHHAPLYSSDALGLATRTVETSWSPQQPREPVVGFFNGAEGDVVGRRGWRDASEVHSAAAQLSAEMVRIGRLRGTPIGATISVKREIAKSEDTCAPGISLASRPMVGAPALGGGEDDRTAAHRLGWMEGVRDVARNGQGVKHPALDPQLIRTEPITEKVAPKWTFPARLPVTAVRLGSFALGALPVEVSTATGMRVRRAMAAHAQGRVELVSMADEYAGYVATPEEYVAQDYMGASTLWGPNEGPFMACLLTRALTTVASTHGEQSFAEQRFDPGEDGDEQDPKVLFGPAAVYERRSAPDEELEHILLTRDHVPARYLPYFEWTEMPANASEEFKFTGRRQVRVTRLSDGRNWHDELGQFVIVLREAPKARTFQWAAIWLGPILGTLPTADRFQFHVTVPQPGPDERTITVSSCPFAVDATSSLLRPPIPTLGQCSGLGGRGGL